MIEIIPITPEAPVGDYAQPSPVVETIREGIGKSDALGGYPDFFYYNAIYATHPEPRDKRPKGYSHSVGTCGYMNSMCGTCHELQRAWHLPVARLVAAKTPPLPDEDVSKYWARVRGHFLDTWYEVASQVMRETAEVSK